MYSDFADKLIFEHPDISDHKLQDWLEIMNRLCDLKNIKDKHLLSIKNVSPS